MVTSREFQTEGQKVGFLQDCSEPPLKDIAKGGP
jgi:hypothetical protein